MPAVRAGLLRGGVKLDQFTLSGRVAVPANLPPQYLEAEKVYRQAKSAAEKLEALETMMPVENIQVQLVDLPPLIGEATPPWQRALMRQADALLLVVDASQDPLTEWATLHEDLPNMRILPVAPGVEPDETEGIVPKKAL